MYICECNMNNPIDVHIDTCVLSLQVISRKRATNYRALLRKMIYRDNGV